MWAGVAYAELDVVFAEEHGVAAHEGDGGLGGHAGSGASLVEHHGHGFAGEAILEGGGGVARLDGGLVGGGIEDELGKFVGAEVVDGCEVTRRLFAVKRPGLEAAHGRVDGTENCSMHGGELKLESRVSESAR